jgi:hypothetical protein
VRATRHQRHRPILGGRIVRGVTTVKIANGKFHDLYGGRDPAEDREIRRQMKLSWRGHSRSGARVLAAALLGRFVAQNPLPGALTPRGSPWHVRARKAVTGE